MIKRKITARLQTNNKYIPNIIFFLSQLCTIVVPYKSPPPLHIKLNNQKKK